jgi:hypothetical protein
MTLIFIILILKFKICTSARSSIAEMNDVGGKFTVTSCLGVSLSYLSSLTLPPLLLLLPHLPPP